MQRADVAKRNRVEPHGEGLIEDRQKVRVLVDAIIKAVVWFESLNEDRLPAIFPIRPVTQIASQRLEDQRATFAPDGKSLKSGIRYLGKDLRGLNAVEVFARRIIVDVSARRARYRQECGNKGNAEFYCELRFVPMIVLLQYHSLQEASALAH